MVPTRLGIAVRDSAGAPRVRCTSAPAGRVPGPCLGAVGTSARDQQIQDEWPLEAFGKGCQHGKGGRKAERLLEVADDPPKTRAAKAAEDFLSAVAEEDDTEDTPHNQEGLRGEGPEEHLHMQFLLLDLERNTPSIAGHLAYPCRGG